MKKLKITLIVAFLIMGVTCDTVYSMFACFKSCLTKCCRSKCCKISNCCCCKKSIEDLIDIDDDKGLQQAIDTKRVDVNKLIGSGEYAFTPITLALSKFKFKTTGVLITAGANLLTVSGPLQWTALHMATFIGCDDYVEKIIQQARAAGYLPTLLKARAKDGRTALRIAQDRFELPKSPEEKGQRRASATGISPQKMARIVAFLQGEEVA